MLPKTSILVIVLLATAAGVAIYVPRLGALPSGKSTTETISTSCTSSTSYASTFLANGTFTASSQSPLRVDYVRANVYSGQNGVRTLQFELGYTNVGNQTVYLIRGCGSSLNSTITSGNGVIKTNSGVVRCLCAEGPSGVDSGTSQTAVTPGCWSGYSYEVVHPGTFNAQLTLGWSADGTPGSQSGYVTVVANFAAP
jgi:hypothetical protein